MLFSQLLLYPLYSPQQAQKSEENISFIIKPVKEGIEEVELLYDSKQEQEEPNELFWENNKIQNYASPPSEICWKEWVIGFP